MLAPWYSCLAGELFTAAKPGCNGQAIFYSTYLQYFMFAIFQVSENSPFSFNQTGLSVELFLDQVNYMSGLLSPQAGARVVVHSPREFPLPSEFGMEAQPGRTLRSPYKWYKYYKTHDFPYFSSFFSLKKQNALSRLPWPHPSDCWRHWNETNPAEVDPKYLSNYLPTYSFTVKNNGTYFFQSINPLRYPVKYEGVHQVLLPAAGSRPLRLLRLWLPHPSVQRKRLHRRRRIAQAVQFL